MGRRGEVIGLALAAYCVANGAFVATAAKLTTHAAQPLSIAFLTSAFGGLAVLALLIARGKLGLLPLWLALEGPAGSPAGDELRQLLPVVAVQGALLGFGGTLAWYAAVKRLDLTRTTAIVVPSVPIVSLVVSYLVLGEKVSAREAAGLALTAGGVLAFALAPSVPH